MFLSSGPPFDRDAAVELLESFRPRLLRMIDLRLDSRLRARIDASDVIQDAFIEVLRRLDENTADARLPFFVWVRFLTLQKLHQLHRQHVSAQVRGVEREVGPAWGVWGLDASAALGAQLADSTLSPSQRSSRDEEVQRVAHALQRMKPLDREILALRHYEQLSNGEAAHILGLQESTAAQRYLRALERLRELLEG